MSAGRADWAPCCLGDVLTLINGRAYSQHEMLLKGTPLLRIQNLNGGKNWFYSNLDLPPDKLCRAGDLLYAWSASFGPYVWDGPTAIFHYHIWKVVPSEAIDQRFAYYLLARITADIRRAAHGVAMPHITKGVMEAWPILLPPMEEQRRIVKQLDAVNKRIKECRARLDRVPRSLKRFREAVLEAAVSGKLTQEWRGSSSLTGWRVERAANACQKVQSGGTPKEGFIDTSGIPFLKVYNLVDQRIDFGYRPQYVSEAVHNGPLAKSKVKPGDVLMNIVGPPLGKVAIVGADHPEWNVNQALTLFRPGPDVSSRWIYFVLCSGLNVREIIHETRGTAGQVNISLSQCRDFQFPIPPMAEQTEAVRRIEEIFGFAESVERQYQVATVLVGKLTQSILGKAFRGELVPQDPRDEPASVLLERIREGREDKDSTPKRSKRQTREAVKVGTLRAETKKGARRKAQTVAARSTPVSARRARSGK